MAERIRALDWAATPLGPSDAWPLPLRTMVEVMLASPMLATLAVGPERVFLYNDEAARHYGYRHPGVLGRPLARAFAHEFAGVAPFYDRVFGGEGLHVPAQRLDPGGRGTAEVFDAYLTPVRDSGGAVIAAHMAGFAVGERLRAEARRHASEKRQAFLLRLSDALRQVGDPVEVQRIATRMLGRHLGATRVFYVVVGDDGDTADILDDYTDGVPSRIGRYSLASFSSSALREWRAGRTSRSDDVADDPRYSPAERAAYASVSTRAGFGVPLIKEGRLVALLGVNQSTPKHWSDDDIGVTGEVAERTWTAFERAQAEAALRESEDRYRTLFQSIDEGIVTLDVIFDAGGRAIDALYLEHNDALGRMAGLNTDIAGKRVRQVLPNLEPFWFDTFEKVVATGEPSRFQYPVRDLDGQWFDVSAARVGGEGSCRIVLVYNDITERRRAEVALREAEERQAFLLKLSDALRPLVDPVAVQAAASRLAGENLKVTHAAYGELEADGQTMTVAQDWHVPEVASTVGRFRIDEAGSFFVDPLRAGRISTMEDAATDPRVDGQRRAMIWDAIGVCSAIACPIVKEGRFVAAFFIHHDRPRRWAEREVALVSEVASRTWDAVQRARAEAALRESEERFGQFAASSSDALWVRDAATLAMEYVSPAIRSIYGVSPASILGDPTRWAALIVPEDRDAALEHLDRARRGEAVTHEFRILRPSDHSFRWIRDTDFPLLDKQGRVQRIGGIAEDVTEAKLAAEHGRILLLELQHRVRNIMAMIRSMADQTGDTVDGAQEYRDRLHGRLNALARVQTLLTREANAGVDLATLVEAELSAQAAHPGQYTAGGPRLQLAPKAAEVLTLAIHELATNALKYGAFSHPAGRLAVAWSCFRDGEQPWLRLDWAESGAGEPLSEPLRQGFGTSLVRERIPYELQGRGSLSVEPDGLKCRLELPLRPGDSILETDTVTLSEGISGGSLDLAGEADLSGCTVLVVEDDFYLARDTARALRRAGAVVVGPVGSEAEALASIAERAPLCALVDIDLGEGARFGVAETLETRGVPFVFVTGYDDAAIPARFDAVGRLRKPVDFRHAVRVAAQMCAT